MGNASTAVERREAIRSVSILSDDEIRRQWRVAEALASSGMFPDAESAAKAFAKMLVGYDLGLSATQSLMGVYLVKGKPQIAATLLAGFIKRTPGYDYKVITHTEDECTIDFKTDGKVVGRSTFTMADAVIAKLAVRVPDSDPPRYKPADKASEGWEKYPRNMLFARALSNGVKWYLPDATGGVAVYAEGELTEGQRDVPQLTEGTESGDAKGLDLGPKVEKVLARAEALGHEAIADRATAEMALASRGPEVAVKWVAEREAELDAFEARPTDDDVPEAEVVEPGTVDERIAALRANADSLDAEAKAETDKTKAREMKVAAAGLRGQAVDLEADVPETDENRDSLEGRPS